MDECEEFSASADFAPKRAEKIPLALASGASLTMNVQKVVGELKKQYPGKNIVINDSDNPTEIICEVEPGSWNPERSVSVAVLDGKVKHYHGISKVTYEVLRGILEMTKSGKSFYISERQKIKLEPDEFHMAKGKETWVKVISEPAWTPEDNIPIEEGTRFA